MPFLATGPAVGTALMPSGATAPSVKGPSNLGTQSFHGLDPNFVPPYSHEMDLCIEQSLPGKLSLSLGYVGTRGMRLPVFIDSQLVGQKPSGIKTYNVLDANGNMVKQTDGSRLPAHRPPLPGGWKGAKRSFAVGLL